MHTVVIKLDRERSIAFSQRALFRMGSLPSPFEFSDLQKPRKSYAALVAWLWACLVPVDAADFATPEDLANHVPIDREACGRLVSALADAINGGAVTKNGNSSTPGTLPASS